MVIVIVINDLFFWVQNEKRKEEETGLSMKAILQKKMKERERTKEGSLRMPAGVRWYKMGRIGRRRVVRIGNQKDTISI